MNHVDHPFEFLTTISICTGIRGLERGVERVTGPLRTIAFVEIEAFIIENLLAGMEAGLLAQAPIWANLKTFPWKHFLGKVGLLIGGYPCQPFSIAGKQKGASDPRHLWPFIKYGIRAAAPVGCFFENVAAHLNLGYQEVKRDLEEMGYVVKEGIYSAEEVGAPHRRERIFVLAIMDNPDSYRFWQKYAISAGGYRIERSSEVADAECSARRPDRPDGHRCFEDDICEKRSEGSDRLECAGEELAHGNGIHGDRRMSFGSAGGGESSNGSEPVADTGVTGLEGQRERKSSTEPKFPLLTGFRGDRWPARPGQLQHEWEEPRLISPMDCTINGYNFREDLLRALGNGVVEQTAELAFRTLLRNHFE